MAVPDMGQTIYVVDRDNLAEVARAMDRSEDEVFKSLQLAEQIGCSLKVAVTRYPNLDPIINIWHSEI